MLAKNKGYTALVNLLLRYGAVNMNATQSSSTDVSAILAKKFVGTAASAAFKLLLPI